MTYILKSLGFLQEQGTSIPAPTDAAAVYNSFKSRIEITWTDNTSDEDNFRMEVDVDGGGYNFLVDPAADDELYWHAPVTPGSEYTYRIRAEKGSEFSAWDYTNGETIPI
jgi:hypothetical protein